MLCYAGICASALFSILAYIMFLIAKESTFSVTFRALLFYLSEVDTHRIFPNKSPRGVTFCLRGAFIRGLKKSINYDS